MVSLNQAATANPDPKRYPVGRPNNAADRALMPMNGYCSLFGTTSRRVWRERWRHSRWG